MNHLPPQPRFVRRPRSRSAVDEQLPRLAPRPQTSSEPRRSLSQTWRRLTQPLPLIGVALIVIALGGYLLVASQSQAHSDVVVAAQNLPAGTVLRPDDLQLTQLAASQTLLAQLVPASQENTLLGRRLAVPVIAGLPLPQQSLASGGGGPAAFTLVIPDLHAVGGDLQTGDRVSVLATFTAANGTASARVIARGLVVLAVGQAPPGLDPASATIPVTVALPNPSVASELALANSVGKIDLLRDGNNPTAPIPPANAGAQ